MGREGQTTGPHRNLEVRAQAVLATLDAEQRAAALASGPAVVVGGAATGKTRVLAHRIAYLCAGGHAAPRRILAFARTERDAQLLRARAERLLAFPLHGAWIDTFHDVCLRILRAHAAVFGRKATFAILGESEARVLVRHAADGVEGAGPFSAARLQELIRSAKEARVAPDGAIGEVYRRYELALADANAVDADDLLRYVIGLLENDAALAAKYRRRFSFVFVDDFEDTNAAQRELIARLAGSSGDLLVAVDEEQALVPDARAALADFRARFPDAPRHALTTTYRSSGRIAYVAGRLIGHGERGAHSAHLAHLAHVAHGAHVERPALRVARKKGQRVVSAVFTDETEEATLVVRWIQRLARTGQIPLARIAVLYRHPVMARPFEEALVRASVPYRVASGPRFYERREIKDVLAYLRLGVGGGDPAALARIANVPRRGIGPASVSTIARLCKTARITMAEAAIRAASLPRVTAARAGALADLGRLLTDLGDAAHRLGAAELVDYVIERSGYGGLLSELSRAEEESRREGLDELRGIARALAGPAVDSLPRLFERVALVSGVPWIAGMDEEPTPPPRGDDGVLLLTFGEAKGRDFEVVFMTGMEEGILPGTRAVAGGAAAIDAERRLAYVVMTRARSRLVITRALMRTLFGQARTGEASRFLGECGRRVRRFRLGAARLAPAGPAAGVEVPAAEAPAAVTWMTSVREGQRVVHPRYGVGLVVRLESGPQPMVSVRFFNGDGDGDAVEKRLLLAFARLLPA